MPSNLSKKYAKVLLDNYGHMRVFEVTLSDEREALVIKDALEEIGCKVEIDPYRPRLTVMPPSK